VATVVIQKRKKADGHSYAVLYKDPMSRKTKYYKSFKRKKDANNAAHELRTLIDTGKVNEADETRTRMSMMTFWEVAEILQGEWKKRVDTGEIKPKTLDEYTAFLRIVTREFGDTLLCQITRSQLLKYRQNVASQFSNVTSNRRLFILKQVFKQGSKLKALLNDPSSDISYLSEKAHERNRFLLPAELDRLVAASLKTRAKFYLPALIYLGAEHGASKQEALSLTWADIDFNYEGQGLIRFFRTKNSRERTEFLMPRSKETLIAWRDHLETARHRKNITETDSNLVFSHVEGRPIKGFNNAFRRACALAGLADFHFHDLRHTFCSNLLLIGSGLKDVKEMIGHNDLSMTDRYSHITMGRKRTLQGLLAEHYARTR